MSYVVQCPPGARVSQGKLEGHAPSWPCTECRRATLLGESGNCCESVLCGLVSWWSVHSTWVPLLGRPAAAPRAHRGHDRAWPSKTRRPRQSAALHHCRADLPRPLEGRAAVASVALPPMAIQSPAPNTATTERGPPRIGGHDGAWPSKTRRPRRSVALQVQQWQPAPVARYNPLLGQQGNRSE
jgi:hypothetical protein